MFYVGINVPAVRGIFKTISLFTHPDFAILRTAASGKVAPGDHSKTGDLGDLGCQIGSQATSLVFNLVEQPAQFRPQSLEHAALGQ